MWGNHWIPGRAAQGADVYVSSRTLRAGSPRGEGREAIPFRCHLLNAAHGGRGLHGCSDALVVLGSSVAQYMVNGWSEPLATLLLKFFLVLGSLGDLRAQRSEGPLRCSLQTPGGTGPLSPLQDSWNEKGQPWAQAGSPGDSVSSCLLMGCGFFEL